MSVQKSETTEWLDVSQRPRETKKAINAVFKSVSIRSPNDDNWTYNGNKKYNICGDDFTTISKIIETNNLDKFTAIDIGAGDNNWAHSVANYLTKNHPTINFTLLSLNGEKCTDNIKKVGNGEIHHLCAFKVEDIVSTLNSKSYSLINNVDLVVSNMVFAHLIDPLGTLQQLTKLIKVNSGMVLTDSFIVSYLDPKQGEIYSLANEKSITSRLFDILSKSNAEFLMCPTSKYKDYPHVAITKHTEEVKFPLKYLGQKQINQHTIDEFLDILNKGLGKNYTYSQAFSGMEGRYVFNYLKQFNSFQDIVQPNIYKIVDSSSCGDLDGKYIGSEQLLTFFDKQDVKLSGDYCEAFEYSVVINF